MVKKFILAQLVCAGLLFGQPTAVDILTAVDTVQVPSVFLKLTDISGGVWKYRGKVSYRIIGWAYDRFNVSMSIVKDGIGEAVPCTMVKGDIGAVNWPGTRSIHFACQFTGQPTGTYKAKISLVPGRSDTAQFIEDLINRLSNGEKQTIINGGSAGGVPGVAWRDGPYGIGSTCGFPCGEGMAATWDTAIAEQGGVYKGYCFRGWGINVMLGPSANLVRDGRAGRTAESYGEDPFVNGKFAAADLRGDTKSGLMVTLKHYCCNNVERARGFYPVLASERSLRELYTYHFGMAAQEGACTGLMTAYNAVNGLHNAQNRHTMTEILKNSWGFKGFILTDWDIGGGNYTASALAGLDLPTPNTWGGALAAMVPGTISQSYFDDKARRWLWARYKTGCFEPGYSIARYKDSILNTTMYNYMRSVTRESMILAKNDNSLLPLDRSKAVKIAVVGAWANTARCGPPGSAQNCPVHTTPPTQAVKQIGGFNVTVTTDYQNADYALVCIGPDDVGEGRDRDAVSLPDTQDRFCGQVLALKPTKTIVFYTGGGCVDSGNWSKAPGIIMGFYPGEDHCLAMAEVLFGDYNPGGKIPFTFPADSVQLPRFGIKVPDDWAKGDTYEVAWEGRGYPYFDLHNYKPLFCFGHGISYTTFAYGNLRISPAGGYPGDTFSVSVDVKNTGTRAGDEVVQVYLHDQQSNLPRRYKDIRGFRRVPLAAGETKTVTFNLLEQDLEYYDDRESAWVVEPGPIDVLVGSSSLDIRQRGAIMIY
jgi:beta-glucosidase